MTALTANLRLARPDATDDELASVLGQFGLGPWLASLPDGLESILGERGTTGSGGERQRLGVARVLLADRPIMVLDEPTARLDPPTTALLVQSVLTAAADKAVLWITHQPDELSSFDHIATIDHGRFRSQVYEVGVVASAPSGAFLVASSMIDRRSAPGQDQARHGQRITREGIPRCPR